MFYSRLKIILALTLASAFPAVGLAAESVSNTNSAVMPVSSRPAVTNILRGSIVIGTGIEYEAGRDNAWLTKIAFQLGYGPFSADLDAGAAYPERALDVAGMSLYYGWNPFPWLVLKPQGIIRWRSFGTAGDETRFGFILNILAGDPMGTMGFSMLTFGGYTYLLTRIPSLDLTWGDHDPVMGIDVLWHNGTGLVLKAGWATFTPDDAGIFMKTFFKFGVDFKFRGMTVFTGLTLKYSDLFTLTAYLDGYALRLAVEIPLNGFFK